jgi:putative NADH-flavin reductase
VRILIVGATGALGRDVVADAVARGHEVGALVRVPSRGTFPDVVEIIGGDVLDPDSLTPAVVGRDAVICALGTPSPRRRSRLLEQGTKNLVGAMSQVGVRRLACVTLLGAGASRANASFFYREVILRVLAPMLPDKQAQERVVLDSELEWVLVRPPRFVAGKPGGDLRVIREGERGRCGRVVRSDVARFLVDCVTDSQYVRQALAVGS